MATERYDHNFPGYEILAQLGRGNARVLKARNQITGELVAIKHFALNTDAETLRRFQLESEIMTAVNHPNIVKIKEVRLDAALPYIVMDFIQGGDLRGLLKKEGTLDIATVVRLGVQIASAFKAIHAKGIIHRDIKPENIMFQQLPTEELHFLLTDFGIAKLREQSNTVTGTSLMTYEYASPEQFDDFKHVTAATDYYSLGIVLYECLSGTVPFPLKDTGMISFIKKVMNDAPPKLISPKRNYIPAGFESLIKALLAKKKEDRLADPDKLQLLLRRAEFEQPGKKITPVIPEQKKQPVFINKTKSVKSDFKKPQTIVAKKQSSNRKLIIILIIIAVIGISIINAIGKEFKKVISDNLKTPDTASVYTDTTIDNPATPIKPIDSQFNKQVNPGPSRQQDVTIQYDEGSYTGQVKDGLPNGHGTFKWNNGHRYVGDWVKGKMEGKGSYYYMEGEYYDGDFKQDDKQGQGIYTWYSGAMYTGEWMNNEMEGFGTFTAGPGQSVSKCEGCRTYKGYWKKGLKEGFGQCYDENDRLLYMGNFKNDEPEDEYPNVDRSTNQ